LDTYCTAVVADFSKKKGIFPFFIVPEKPYGTGDRFRFSASVFSAIFVKRPKFYFLENFWRVKTLVFNLGCDIAKW